MIKPSMEAFRLTDVETTLSKITKKEVKFLIPESLKENITIGKPITFSLGDNESKSYTGSIYRISPEVDEQTLSIIVQAKVNDTISLPNKSTLRVNIETQEEIYKLPSSTIYNKEERKIIYYKKEN
jgi:multidrug efflux pump subunit AcrA (membrane-fusion protein)